MNRPNSETSAYLLSGKDRYMLSLINYAITRARSLRRDISVSNIPGMHMCAGVNARICIYVLQLYLIGVVKVSTTKELLSHSSHLRKDLRPGRR